MGKIILVSLTFFALCSSAMQPHTDLKTKLASDLTRLAGAFDTPDFEGKMASVIERINEVNNPESLQDILLSRGSYYVKELSSTLHNLYFKLPRKYRDEDPLEWAARVDRPVKIIEDLLILATGDAETEFKNLLQKIIDRPKSDVLHGLLEDGAWPIIASKGSYYVGSLLLNLRREMENLDTQGIDRIRKQDILDLLSYQISRGIRIDSQTIRNTVNSNRHKAEVDALILDKLRETDFQTIKKLLEIAQSDVETELRNLLNIAKELTEGYFFSSQKSAAAILADEILENPTSFAQLLTFARGDDGVLFSILRERLKERPEAGLRDWPDDVYEKKIGQLSGTRNKSVLTLLEEGLSGNR